LLVRLRVAARAALLQDPDEMDRVRAAVRGLGERVGVGGGEDLPPPRGRGSRPAPPPPRAPRAARRAPRPPAPPRAAGPAPEVAVRAGDEDAVLRCAHPGSVAACEVAADR